jgi:polyribonucleotide nucleotidyltransferase
LSKHFLKKISFPTAFSDCFGFGGRYAKVIKAMGKQIPISTSFHLPDGREVTIETGKLATQADGSVLVRMGKTMLLGVVTASPEARPDQDFFPLSVDYQEKFASAGRIPGNFFRRETKLSDYEVIVSRLVDRAIRPLFPENYRNDTQIIVNLISGEKETLPDALVALAASSALAVSNIPFNGPISEVRVARIEGVFKVNPTRSEVAKADINIIVGATMQDVTMVEGEANECAEKDLVEAIKVGHEAIKVQIQAQLTLAKLVGNPEKRVMPELPSHPELEARIKALASEPIRTVALSASAKNDRKNAFKAISKTVTEALVAAFGEEFMTKNARFAKDYFDKVKKNVIRLVVLNDGARLDGRHLTEVRPIWSEIEFLPSAHGSAIFNRGETQALISLTLGTKLDEMMNDTAMEMSFEKFILHYNFPGFSVGEVKPQRAPARREVGHANLAARSLRKILPTNAYTIRLVSDILESNGSSSMATVCAGSLALMDGGIQIPCHVAGIAMGMIAENGKTAILSDILGDEDALGDMDFKVTGTEKGICGCQMDIKINGLPYEMLEKALLQAKEGRLHILNEMNKTISKPADDLKPHAPRVAVVIIDKEFIGAIIGPGGKIIQEMQRETGTTINIEEIDGKGQISVFASDKVSIDAALARIGRIVYMPQVGDVEVGIVESVMPYGVFLGFKSKSGLLHVSEMSWSRIDNVEDEFKEGDEVRFKIIDIDKKTGKLRLSRKILLPQPAKGAGGDDNQGSGDRRPPRDFDGGRDNNRNRDNDRGGDRRPPRRF